MKRYLLFAGSTYYPGGGWGDFKGDFDSINDAVREFMDRKYPYDWYHVIDAETAEKVDGRE